MLLNWFQIDFCLYGHRKAWVINVSSINRGRFMRLKKRGARRRSCLATDGCESHAVSTLNGKPAQHAVKWTASRLISIASVNSFRVLA